MAPATVNFSCMTQQVDMTQQVEFQHVPRQANKSVYNIARHARHQQQDSKFLKAVFDNRRIFSFSSNLIKTLGDCLLDLEGIKLV